MIKRLMIIIIGLFLVATPTFASINTADLDGYWGLEESGFNYLDETSASVDFSSGVASTQSATAKYGTYSQFFDGGSSGIGGSRYVGNTQTWGLDNANFTFNAWVYPTFLTGSYGSNFDAIISQNVLDVWLGVEQDGRIRAHLGGSSRYIDLPTGTLNSNNVWHMITLTWDGTTPKLYVNGTYVTPSSSSGVPSMTGGGQLQVATYNNGQNNNWQGNLDELSAWSATLGASEISELYNDGYGLFYNSTSGAFDINPKTLASGLTNYYSLEESGFNYIDSHGSVDLTSGTASTQTTGIINYGQDMNGDSLANTGTGWGSDVQTISMWIDINTLIPNQNHFITDNQASPMDVYFDNSYGLHFHDSGSLETLSVTQANHGISTGSGWHHVVAVFDGSNSKIYVDGSSKTLASSTFTGSAEFINGIYLGSYKGSLNYNGKMDEVGVWDRPLSSSEVTELYNGGSGLSYSDIAPYDVSNINNNINRYYAMEDASGNIVDSTGNYDGVATGIGYQSTGKIDYGIEFDGTSGDKVDTGYDIQSAQQVMSTCQWVRPTALSSWRSVWRNQDGGNINHGLQQGGSGAYLNKWRYTAYYGGVKFDTISTTSLSNGVYTHLCTTNDGSTAKLYVNGVMEDSDSVTSTSVSAGTHDLTLGQRPDVSTELFSGQIDEFALWDNYVLTQNDINFLYASGAPSSNQQYVFATSAPNTNPTITAIADQSMNEDTTLNVTSAFTIGDAEDAISDLTLSYSGYNSSLLNTTSISFDVNTTTGVVDMAITPLPDAYGVTNVTINVTDTSAGTNSSTFELTIFNVNDAPTITAISSPQIVTESNTLVINFNVTDIDNPYTDLVYSAVAGDVSLIDSATFSNYDGTNQTLTIVASADFGKTDINVSVRDLQPAIASTTFDYIVNCNTTTRYYSPMNVTEQEFVGSTTPTTCFDQTFTYNTITDILTYTWHDFGQTMNNIKFWAYDTTGNFRIPLNETTLTGNNGTLTIDYSAVNPNYNILAIADLTDNTRSFYTGSGVSSTARILDVQVDQAGQLGSLFSVSDGIVYGVLILLLFLTLGIASQSASLTLIFSILGLFIASKFVLRIPSQFIWITGALVVILLYLIAKLRTD